MAAQERGEVGAAPRLADVLGQERARRALESALSSGRAHHAWIFHGPPGVGKLTAAVAFAAALLDPTTAETLTGEIAPDPESETQRLIARGAHPDLRIVTKELARHSTDRSVRERKLTSIPKEVIERHLLDPAARSAWAAPGGGAGARAGKVFIVDEAELLNLPTQNALLKTLEEPAAGTVMILATSAAERLLATILSRCQRVAFGALDEESMRAWTKRHVETHEGVSKGALERAAARAGGSPGRALEMLEGGAGEWEDRLEEMLGRAERGELAPTLGKTMHGLVDGWAKAQVEASPQRSKDAANKQGARMMFRLLGERARGRLRGEEAHEVAGGLAMIDAIQEAERHVAANVNLSIAMDHLAMRLAESGEGG